MLRPSQRPPPTARTPSPFSLSPSPSPAPSPSPYPVSRPFFSSALDWPYSRSSSPLPVPTKMGPGPRVYDAEAAGSPSSAGRIARRWFARRYRWLLGAAIGGTVVLYYLDAAPAFIPHHRPPHQHPPGSPPPPEGFDEMQGIWEGDDGDPPPKGWGSDSTGSGGGGGKTPHPPENAPSVEHAFIVDEHGDHFYPSYPDPLHIPPFDPDISQLPLPASLFPEVSISSHLRPPTEEPFPEESIPEIISEEYPQLAASAFIEMAEDAFVNQWTPADELWDGRGKHALPQVQWEGFKKGKYESKAERKERLERKEAVRRGFVHAWQAYKDHAWGYDEIKPVSMKPSDPFNNWGASIIDTIDTILIMDLPDEYTLCRPHINQVNFHWLGGKDWSRGYQTPPAEDQHLLLSETGEPADFSEPRDRQTNFAVFETGIRYLGGLLAGYDLSGDSMLLERAVELGDILAKAFNTEYGLPMGRMDPGYEHWYHLFTVSIAEVGSMTLELTRLSQITGNRKYYDLSQRAIDYLEQKVIPRTLYEPLIPLYITPSSTGDMLGTISWGGLADSYYEYLIKQYKLLGGSAAAEQYKRMYIGALETAKTVLFHDVTAVPGRDLLAIGKIEGSKSEHAEVEHLTCFAGGMMGLGSRLLNRPDDMEDAERFAKTCYWLSAATPTGLQPEGAEFYLGEDAGEKENVTVSGDKYHPYWENVNLEAAAEENLLHRDRNDVLRWNGDGKPVFPDDGGRTEEAPIEYFERVRGVPAGTMKVSGRGINRPETIESIFYMYRLTGDRKWQNRGWKMFTAWAEVAKVDGGMSSVYDVTQEHFAWSDNMESFTFAETFKYHYLLHCEPDHMSLDDYVLSTEAHPFISNPKITPGSQKFWKAPKSQNLGVQGRGSHAQMWVRLKHLKERAASFRTTPAPPNPNAPWRDAKQGGGGKGMGGGGGDPNFRPRPPPDFQAKRPPKEEGEAEDED